MHICFALILTNTNWIDTESLACLSLQSSVSSIPVWSLAFRGTDGSFSPSLFFSLFVPLVTASSLGFHRLFLFSVTGNTPLSSAFCDVQNCLIIARVNQEIKSPIDTDRHQDYNVRVQRLGDTNKIHTHITRVRCTWSESFTSCDISTLEVTILTALLERTED